MPLLLSSMEKDTGIDHALESCYEACQRGDIEGFLEHVSINKQYEDGSTLMHMAIKYLEDSNLPISRLLLQKGACPNLQNDEGNTPLHMVLRALEKQDMPLDRLLEKKKCGEELIPLEIDHLRSFELVKLLYHKGEEYKDLLLKGPVLQVSLMYNQNDKAQFLIDSGADINWKEGCGDSLLHICCQEANRSAVDLLLKNNADFSVKNNVGDTIFHSAALSDKKSAQVFECCVKIFEQLSLIKEPLSCENKKTAEIMHMARKRKECILFQVPRPVLSYMLGFAGISNPQFFVALSPKDLLATTNKEDETAAYICYENSSDDALPEKDRAGWLQVAKLLDPEN
jgi:ankyrin repeat protein